METLSSCYFCGGAVDAAVEEYPLVRSDVVSDVDTGQRIDLCPSCRRKLTSVIEQVLEAAFDGSEPAVDALDAEHLQDIDADEELSATSVDTLAEDTDAATDATDTTAEEWGIDPESPEAETEGESVETETEDEPGTAGLTPPRTESGGQASETVDRSDGGTEEDTPESADSREDATPESADAREDATPGSTGEAVSETPTTASSESASDGAENHQYSKSEFNKIVRLLQNREFPVDIDELVVVSRSAYGIDEGTCHAVINALIERGVIADQGEELVRA